MDIPKKRCAVLSDQKGNIILQFDDEAVIMPVEEAKHLADWLVKAIEHEENLKKHGGNGRNI